MQFTVSRYPTLEPCNFLTRPIHLKLVLAMLEISCSSTTFLITFLTNLSWIRSYRVEKVVVSVRFDSSDSK
jgi:hypothetical protein